MVRLRRERENYFQWKSGQSELEKLEKVLVANEYMKMQKMNGEKQLDQRDNARNLTESEEQLQVVTMEQQVLEKNMEVVRAEQRNQASTDEYRKLEEQYKEQKKEIIKLESIMKNTNESIEKSGKE